MKLLNHAVLAGTLLATAAAITIAAPTVFPTGTTIYKPEETWSGFTVLSILDTPAVIVLDMNGRVVKRWEGFNVSAGGPARIFPDGSVIAPSGVHPPHQESVELVHKDFDGNVIWSFRQNEQIKDTQGATVLSSRQHHDWQRTDFPAGYYSPAANPGADVESSNILLLTHTTLKQPAVAEVDLEDDRLIEISATGELLWDWRASDHIDEFQFDAAARATIKSQAGEGGPRGYDWLHVNSAHYVGPNPWFDAGDQRFAPDNVIISSRQASLIAVIARDGSVAWQLGPDFSRSKEQQALGQIIGQHHAHFIPPGLPGAGNVLIYDNGGSSGYGAPSPIAPTGVGIYARSTSRVLEINPVTLELVWMYTAPNFFSTNISGAQRLPNGNTLITEGAPGRIFEVTSAGAIVWEYMNAPGETGRKSNSIYRAYRMPYSWIPQLGTPQEIPVTAPPPGEFVIGL